MLNSLSLKTKQEGNADPALNPYSYIFHLIFQHNWLFLSTMQTLPNQIPYEPEMIISIFPLQLFWCKTI